MPFTIKAVVTGLDDIVRTVSTLRQSVQNRFWRKALRRAASIINKEAKRGAPRETGLLRKSIGIIKVDTLPDGRVAVLVGPRPGFAQTVTVSRNGRRYKEKRNPVFYAHLVERGTKPHALGSGSSLRNRGKVKKDQKGAMHPGARAQPFLRPAFDNNKARVKQTIADVMRVEIQKEVERIRRKKRQEEK